MEHIYVVLMDDKGNYIARSLTDDCVGFGDTYKDAVDDLISNYGVPE